MEKVRDYETTFVLQPDLEEETRENIIERIKDVITSNDGEIKEIDTWGTRKLAYEIDDCNSGYYTIIYFTGRTGIVEELEHSFKIIGNVLRHLIIRKED